MYPHLIFDNFSTPLGERTKTILQHLFPVPKDESKRVVTFANRADFLSFRHHMYNKTGYKEVELKEVGPRFEMRLFQVRVCVCVCVCVCVYVCMMSVCMYVTCMHACMYVCLSSCIYACMRVYELTCMYKCR